MFGQLINNTKVKVRPSNNGKVLKTLKAGTKVEIIEEKEQWYKIAEGYIPIGAVELIQESSYVGVVSAAALNVRSYGSYEANILYIIYKNNKLTIYKEVEGWGKISKDKNEWVCLDFIDKI